MRTNQPTQYFQYVRIAYWVGIASTLVHFLVAQSVSVLDAIVCSAMWPFFWGAVAWYRLH